MYILLRDNLQKKVPHECYDSKWKRQLRIHYTLTLTEDIYFWPQIWDNVETYEDLFGLPTDKTEQKSSSWLLKSLPILERPRESILMEFIVNLPKCEDVRLLWSLSTISLGMQHLSQWKDCSVDGLAWLFMKHVVKY